MIQNEEFINEFVEEAKSHIEKVEAALLKREKIRNDMESINEIFRAVHSIKGTAGFFGLKKIVNLSHAMENVFAVIRNGKMLLDDQMVDLMLSSNDCLKDMTDNVLHSEEADVGWLIERLENLLSSNETEQTGNGPVTVLDIGSRKFNLMVGSYEFLAEGLRHGHKVYEIRLHINRDLLSYREGPIKLFNKIQAVGMLIDTYTDHSEINTFEDILEAVSTGSKDVYLGILVTSVLDRALFSQAVDIPENSIYQMTIGKDDNYVLAQPKENIRDDRQTEKAAVTQKSYENIGFSGESDGVDERNEQPANTVKQLVVEDSIRVHVSVLNDILNMASEMVLGRNQLLRTLEDYRKTIPGLSPILQNIDRLTSGMQEKIMQTRMQPMANVFNKFPRIIRDLSKSLGKEIDLQLEGTEVELDKSVIEALADPMVHLVRNAADHGLEMPEERLKRGKNRVGVIKLKAFHEGGYVNIEVIDDGAGIDPEKIGKKAVEKGIASSDEISRMSEKELLKLIFKPGFSTAERVNDLSGRGVGMDVVKTNIEKLGGSIEIFTKIHVGTTLRLMLPLTLAIIQSLIVGVEGQKFALPQVNLKEIVRIKEKDKSRRIEFLHDSEVLRLRGKLLPIVHLADILGIQRFYTDLLTGERKPERRKSFSDERRQNSNGVDPANSRREDADGIIRVLVLQMGLRHFGLAVDSIFSSEETLVKPLPVYFKNCDCYSGVTIMGDGKTAMILDVEGLIRISGLKFKEEAESITNDRAAGDLHEKQDILLFKCSGSETYAIDLAMVSRVEEVSEDDIEAIGDKEYIKFRGDSLRVIHPEDFLPVNRGEKGKGKKYVLIPKLVSHPIGIIAEKIIDNVTTALVLNTDGLKVDGLLGTTIYDNKITLLINMYELFEKADPLHYAAKTDYQAGSGTILLVEDTPFFQRLEKEYLEGAGYKVLLAGNGKEALELLRTQQIDAVVSDIQMPLMDGLELVKRIREDPETAALPVIALTSMAGEHHKRIGIDSGFDHYELKLDRDRLTNILHQVLSNAKRG